MLVDRNEEARDMDIYKRLQNKNEKRIHRKKRRRGKSQVFWSIITRKMSNKCNEMKTFGHDNVFLEIPSYRLY